jgi:hypothetical protein
MAFFVLSKSEVPVCPLKKMGMNEMPPYQRVVLVKILLIMKLMSTYSGRNGVYSVKGIMLSSEPFMDKKESEPARTTSLFRSKSQCKGRLDVAEC